MGTGPGRRRFPERPFPGDPVPGPAGLTDPGITTRALLLLGAVAIVGGVLTGLVGTAFQITLAAADDARVAMVDWARHWPWVGWVVPVLACGAGVALARLVVRFAPIASGSGVQRVEAVMRGEVGPAPLSVVPAKFVGGVLAIGSGLALGREGPSVQMGAVIGDELARRTRMDHPDLRSMQAAMAGAGLAVAFNAPLGGAVFVFEEVSRSFRLRLAVATLVGTACAIATYRAILGDFVLFDVPELPEAPLATLPLFALLGVLLGVAGVAYNRFVVTSIDVFARSRIVPVELRAGIVGAAVGLLAWLSPELVGGGDALNQRILDGRIPLLVLGGILAVRWVLGPVSYALGTVGGLFAPLLVVGAAGGALLGGLVTAVAPGQQDATVAFAVVGMAAFFTAVVRAPFTGIVLIAEMTGSTSQVVPLLLACGAAMLTATLLRGEPIYDTLRSRMLAMERTRGGG